MPFRVNARNYFITYPQCDKSPEDVATFIAGIRSYSAILSVRETHEDGNPHIHVLVQFDRKFDCKNERQFDFDGFHPNITAARSVADCEKYCRKGSPEGENIFETGIFSGKRLWSEIIDATTSEEVHSLAKEISPRDYVLSYDRICQYAETKKFVTTEYVSRFTNFLVPEGCQKWLTEEFRKVLPQP